MNVIEQNKNLPEINSDNFNMLIDTNEEAQCLLQELADYQYNYNRVNDADFSELQDIANAYFGVEPEVSNYGCMDVIHFISEAIDYKSEHDVWQMDYEVNGIDSVIEAGMETARKLEQVKHHYGIAQAEILALKGELLEIIECDLHVIIPVAAKILGLDAGEYELYVNGKDNHFTEVLMTEYNTPGST